MTTRTKVLEVSGPKARETAELFGGRVIRAIFVIEDTTERTGSSTHDADNEVEGLLAEMDAHAVHAGDMDDSREAIYTRLEGE
jgi:hypothetical protein